MLLAMETAILLVLSATTVLSLWPGKRYVRLVSVGAMFVAVLLVADWLLGHGRWQMIPSAFLTIVLLLVSFIRSRRQQDRKVSWPIRLGHGAFGLLAVSFLVGALLPPLLFPMFAVPTPTGDYGVGYAEFQLTDTTRLEVMSSDPEDKRELMVSVWYPSDVPEGAQPLPFLKQPAALKAVFPQFGSFASTAFSHLEDIPGYSYAQTPLSAKKAAFPVLVFNHGMGMFGSANSLMLENLASHGYLVFSLEHTYHASVVTFPDGRRSPYKVDWMQGSLPVSIKKMVSDMAAIQYAADYDAYSTRIADLLKGYPVLDQGISLWVADIAFLLDQLAIADDGRNPTLERFAGRLDLEKTGVFGMSFGGAAAGMFCLTENRCKAGINLDGLQLGTAGKIERFALEVPFMLMNSDRRIEYGQYLQGERDWRDPPEFGMNDFVFLQANAPAYTMTIAGAAHNNFTDLAFVSPLGKWAGLHGDVPPETMNKIMNEYALAFFNQHLMDVPSSLLAGQKSGYPGLMDFKKRQSGMGKDPSLVN